MDLDESLAADRVLMVVLAEVRKIFGDCEVSADENFFALGGSSLDAVELAACLESEYGLKIGIAELFAAETLAEIAAVTQRC
jgi:acyl carrier protein